MLSLRLVPGTTKEIPFPAASIWRRKFELVIGLDAALDQHYSVRASFEPHGTQIPAIRHRRMRTRTNTVRYRIAFRSMARL
jgi:hypothetical protein